MQGHLQKGPGILEYPQEITNMRKYLPGLYVCLQSSRGKPRWEWRPSLLFDLLPGKRVGTSSYRILARCATCHLMLYYTSY